jgi:hypothetical protein
MEDVIKFVSFFLYINNLLNIRVGATTVEAGAAVLYGADLTKMMRLL